MRIIEAKQIPLETIVTALGGTYTHTRGKAVWFKSPFRPGERTASFKVDLMSKRWHDFGHAGGQGAGGDIIDLWCEAHNLDRRKDVKQALEGLSQFQGNPIYINKQEITQPQVKEQPRFEIIKLHDRIKYQSLLNEINRRRIPLDLANRYLKQAWIRDNKYPSRKLNGFAFKNDEKYGWEISIPNPQKGKSFKTSISGKAPTTFMTGDQSRAEIFEGFWDFLSWLAMNNRIEPDCITYVLNSISFVSSIANKIIAGKNIKTVIEFLDNDAAGEAARMNLSTVETRGLSFYSQNYLYWPHKDLNDFRMLY